MMRRKKKKFFGMPIPDRNLSREELQSLSEDEIKGLGLEMRFWPWYLRISWIVARIFVILLLLGAAIGFGTSLLSGEAFDFMSLAEKFLYFLLLAFLAPVVFLVVSYLWWYGSIAIDKMRGNSQEHR